jgi:DNA-binding sugar fermentation-stimulating protein
MRRWRFIAAMFADANTTRSRKHRADYANLLKTTVRFLAGIRRKICERLTKSLVAQLDRTVL